MLLFTISQLPPNCSDSDIRNALLPYGAVHEMQIRYDRNEVNVTMEATSSALTLVRHQRSLVVRGATVPISQAPRAPQHSAPSHSQHNFSQHQHHVHHQHHQPQQWQQPAPQDPSYAVQQSSTVFVTVEQCQYPINEGVLREVFTRVGTIVDVSCSPAGGPTTTGTVTFASHASADAAVRDLNGKQIYPNCCIMHITKAQPAISYSPAPAAMPFFQHAPQFMLQHHGQQPPQVGSFVMNNGYSSAPPSQHGAYAPAPSVGMPPTRGGSMGGRGGRGGGGRGGLMMPGHDMAPPSAPYGGTPEAPVLIISNVTESASLHSLWVLLEVYGNVNSLKRQHTHKTSVVAMFQNLHDARGAVVHLQNCPFFGSVLSVKHFAGYQDRGGSRVEWNAGPATDPNTIAYQFHANHHRTKPSAPYNPKQKNRPDCNLFISNLTEEITDAMVEELFTSRGFQVVEHYRKAMNASIVRLDSVEKSVEALIATHAQQVNGRYVYVAFSRFAPGPAPANAGESGEESGNNQFAETAGYNEDAAVQQQ